MKIVADTLVLHDQKILLVKADYRSTWQFPGGHVDLGETPYQAASREVAEEVGAGVCVKKLLCLNVERDAQGRADAMCFLFSGCYDGTTPIVVDGQEIHQFAWVSIDDAAKKLNPLVSILVPHALTALERNAVVYLEGGALK